MKKSYIYLFLVFNFLMISCSEKENPVDKLNKNLAEYIKQNANDPESYEALETEITDTLMIEDLIAFDLIKNKRDLEKSKTKRLQMLQDQKDYPEIDYSSGLILRDKIDAISNNNLKKLNGIEDTIGYILSSHSCRLKNEFGALSKEEYMVFTDEDLNILFMMKYDENSKERMREDLRERFMENYDQEE